MSQISQACWEHNRRLYREMLQREMLQSSSSKSQTAKPPQPHQLRQPTQDLQQLDQTSLHTIQSSAGGTMDNQPGRNQRAPTGRSAFALSRHSSHSSQASSAQEARITSPSDFYKVRVPGSIDQISYHSFTPTSSRMHQQPSQKPRPDYIDQTVPPLPRPSKPALLQQTLNSCPPSIFVVEYSCGCRNHGICVHYQICFRRDLLPDGLICQRCQETTHVPQEVIKGKRKCPRHVDDSGKERNFVRSRPEDFLPSQAQRKGYEAWLVRSVAGKWEEFEGMKESGGEMMVRGGMQEARAPGSRAIATATRRNVPAPQPGFPASTNMVAPAPQRRFPSATHMIARGNGMQFMMPGASTESLSETRQNPMALNIPPPAAWHPQAPSFATATYPIDHTSFQASSWNPQFTRTSTAYQQDHMEALADNRYREIQAANRERGIINQDNSGGMLYADLQTFETGEPYNPDPNMPYGGSGFGGY